MRDNSRIFWGIALVIIGLIFLFVKLDVLSLNWRALTKLWPLMLIFWGAVLLAPIKKGWHIVLLFLGILLIGAWGYQYTNSKYDDFNLNFKNRSKGDKNLSSGSIRFSESLDDGVKEAKLFLDLGAGVYSVTDGDSGLVDINGETVFTKYKFEVKASEGIKKVYLKQKGGNIELGSDDEYRNELFIDLSREVVWDLDVDAGAAILNFDLSELVVQKFKLESGASKINIKLGAKGERTDVIIDTGISALVIELPKDVACEAKTDVGLSSKSYEGLKKVNDGLYRSENFDAAARKVYIDLDAGLSSIKVRRY